MSEAVSKPEPQPAKDPPPLRIGRIGVAAVLFGVLALGLTIVPRIVFDVPSPWQKTPEAKPETVVEGGKTIGWKGIKFTYGGKTKVVYPPPPPAAPVAVKVVFIASVVLALAGILGGVVAAWYERSLMLGGSAITLCAAALLWEYILMGIAIAVAIIVLMLLVSALSGAFP